MSDYLTVTDHNRVFNAFQYVYPVLSRRAGGISLGINLNTNNACNWRCIYCQVPDLKRGNAPLIDIKQLKNELELSLEDILHGTFLEAHVDAAHRVLKDIAFSGNGEPTSSSQFCEVLECLENVLNEKHLLGQIKVRLITNGSQLNKPYVKQGIAHLARLNGEVWFKLDAGRTEDIRQINDINIDVNQHLARLKICAQRCPTYVQTCLFAYKNKVPSNEQLDAYLSCLESVKSHIQGVMLYGVARPSYQPEAKDISRLPITFLEDFARRIEALGLEVTVSE